MRPGCVQQDDDEVFVSGGREAKAWTGSGSTSTRREASRDDWGPGQARQGNTAEPIAAGSKGANETDRVRELQRNYDDVHDYQCDRCIPAPGGRGSPMPMAEEGEALLIEGVSQSASSDRARLDKRGTETDNVHPAAMCAMCEGEKRSRRGARVGRGRTRLRDRVPEGEEGRRGAGVQERTTGGAESENADPQCAERA
ncbi:hypothetical protein CC80DRAFT_532261 [Byssothecium circinans]|uniref:Uncharacterized protein n=1 Tax=Byssothecium circinans TaxID=147558 RepID=A0A6A5U6U9_9PLEO|nr:hypothetical protein CC80DRAFT_532261 [Byssothecium circinans]